MLNNGNFSSTDAFALDRSCLYLRNLVSLIVVNNEQTFDVTNVRMGL